MKKPKLMPAFPVEVAKRQENQRMGAKVYSLVSPIPQRGNSFWYSGDVARIAHAGPEGLRGLVLVAQGEIEIVFIDEPDRIYRGDDAVQEALRRGYIDTDLVEEGKGTGGKVKEWKRNNYFQFGCESPKWTGRIYIGLKDGGEIFRDYNQAVDRGRDIITDCNKWFKYTSSLK